MSNGTGIEFDRFDSLPEKPDQASLEIIEVQSGSYMGEDGIERYETFTVALLNWKPVFRPRPSRVNASRSSIDV